MRPKREGASVEGAVYFISTQTIGRKPFFRHERWARLILETLERYDGIGYRLHAYVVMPDHLHFLIRPIETIERAVQLIKGGFSYRARRDLEWRGEIWQPGFTDHRIRDEIDWRRHLDYIRKNPVEAGLVTNPRDFEFMGFPASDFPQGLKPAGF